MSFDIKKFSPIFVHVPQGVPRGFIYCNEEDLLSEIMEPGYFNKQRNALIRNSFIKVICKNAVVEIIVEEAKHNSDVTIRPEFFRASDPYTDLISPKKQRNPRKKKEEVKEETQVVPAG